MRYYEEKAFNFISFHFISFCWVSQLISRHRKAGWTFLISEQTPYLGTLAKQAQISIFNSEIFWKETFDTELKNSPKSSIIVQISEKNPQNAKCPKVS